MRHRPRLPGHAQSWFPVAVGVWHQPLANAPVTRKHKAQWGVGERCALLSWDEGCTPAPEHPWSDIRIPSQAEGKAQIWPHPELILSVYAKLPAGNASDLARSLCVRLQVAEQEVCQSATGVLAIEP